MSTPPPDALALHATRAELIATFSDAEATVRQAFASIVGVEERLATVFAGGDHARGIRVQACSCHHSDDWTDVEKTIERMRRQAWCVIVDRLELRRALSLKRAEEMDKALREGDVPPITEQTVLAFIAHHNAALPTMIEEAMIEVFDWLRPHEGSRGDDYKTNQRHARFELGERIVLTHAVERGWGSGEQWHVQYSSYGPGMSARMTALENIFSSLDGAGQFTRSHRSDIENAISAAGPDGKWATRYFSGRCYGNGNLHLRFLRPDLLAEFNRRVGGRTLRPAA